MNIRGLVVASALGLFACSNGASGGDAESDPSPQEIPPNTFGGLCIPTASANALGTLDSNDDSGCGLTHGGRGTALSVRALAVATRLGDSGTLASTGGNLATSVVTADVAGIVGASALSGASRSDGTATRSSSSVAGVRVNVAGVGITAALLASSADASCTTAAGTSVITDLRINGAAVHVTGAPNQTIDVGLVKVVINEQVASSGAIVVTALHVTAANVADVAISASRASLECPCGEPTEPPPPPAPPAPSAPASSSSGSSGTPGPGGSIETPDPGSDFGQPGDACDARNGCADGHTCKPVIVR